MTDETTDKESSIDKLARVVTSAFVKARIAMEPELQAHKWQATTEYVENLEQSIYPTMSRMLANYRNLDALPDHLKEAMNLATEPQHAYDFLLQIGGFIGQIFALVPQLGRIESQAAINQLWSQNTDMPLSVADATDGVVRGIIDYADAAQEATLTGFNGKRFDWMVGLTGEPPGPMDVLSLWRRGLITQDELEQAIKFSRLKDQYIPWIEWLAHSYMSPADVIELCVKGIIDLPTGREMWAIAGALPEQFDDMYQAAGNSIGAVEAMNLWNHGLITEAQVDTVLGRSRINPMFYDIAKLQRHKFLGVLQIEAMVKAGTVDPQQAIQWLVQDGYPQDQATALVVGLQHAQTAKPKGETEALIVKQYMDKLVTADDATNMLEQIGYNGAAAAAIIATADAQYADKQLTGAVAKVRAAYVSGHITRVQASNDLDTLGVVHTARDQWLTDWDVEKSANFKVFTMAELGTYAKHGAISYDYAATQWIAMGYSAQDAQILRAYYGDASVKTPVV